ncbi:MAG: site-specific integrase [Methylobacter sp.]|uniref:Site-specific integrase n=1 Tax=Candidatus Methylobacter titanis TaxID=3053457 RepID=A0AA43Q8F9_9GAMM|nr:site-specific integrase [Candidatus Methylobacter titanis]
MEIELFKDPDSDMLIPFVKGTLQKEFFEFLVYRYHWPTRINSKMKAVSGSSLRNIAYDIKQLLEALSHNNVHISDVTYELHLKKLLDEQQKEYNWRNETFNSKYSRCREFFEFLTVRGISHKAVFPAKRVGKHYSNRDDDFFSHTHNEKSHDYSKDDGHKRTTITDNYTEYVISMDKYFELYKRLKKIDPVYAVMAQTMMQTCLRVGNTCQIPLSHSPLNPDWKLWPELNSLDLEFLKFHHIAKGGKLTWCYVWPATIKSIYNDYIDPFYAERKKLYNERYIKRKNTSLKQGQVILPNDILWLNENGTPVKPYMLEAAFRSTKMDIHPHCLRHTGATHLLWNYCNLKGIDPDERMAAQFHSFLQNQLGHHSIETTRYYIRTITCKRAQLVVPFALPGNREQLDKRLPEGAAEKMKMLNFFEGASVVISENQD